MNKLGEGKKEVDACENCKTKLCESGATMNNISGLIEGLESIKKDYKASIRVAPNLFEAERETLSQTISILKSLDSGGKIVPEEKEIHQLLWDSSSLGSIYCTKVAKAIRSKLLINRAAFMERLPEKIDKVSDLIEITKDGDGYHKLKEYHIKFNGKELSNNKDLAISITKYINTREL